MTANEAIFAYLGVMFAALIGVFVIVRILCQRAEKTTASAPGVHVPNKKPESLQVPPSVWNTAHGADKTPEETTGRNIKGQLKDSSLMKELLRSRDPIEVDVLKMIQNGASVEDIRRRHGKEVANRANEIKDKAREELKAKIMPMVAAGMTMEDVIKKLNQHFDSPLNDALNPERVAPRIKTSQSITDPSPAPEGGRKRKTNYAVVRSKKLRQAAIQIHGRNCSVCGFNFDEAFGQDLAQGYIEIHHLNGIASGVRNTDPATDLAPLCSNCHAMADRLTLTLPSPPKSIEELRELLLR